MSGRMKRIINYTLTAKDTWYKVFDIVDYKDTPIYEVKVKLRETSTADHFRYNFDGSTTIYMTSTSGWVLLTNLKKLYVYMPDYAGEVLEIEVQYK